MLRCRLTSANCSWGYVVILASTISAMMPATIEQVVYSQAHAADEVASEDERALSFFTDWINKHPTHVKSYLGRATILWKQGKTGDAMRDLESARSFDSYLADVTQASLHLFTGEAKKAEDLLANAISTEPERFEAYLQRANLRLSQNKKLAAAADLTSALSFCPEGSLNSCECAYLRAEVLFDLGKYHEAIQDTTDAINRKLAINQRDVELGLIGFPTDPRHFFLRGNAFAKLGDYQRAIADYNICETTDVHWPQLYLNRAECHRQLGDLEREKADRKKAQETQSSQK